MLLHPLSKRGTALVSLSAAVLSIWALLASEAYAQPAVPHAEAKKAPAKAAANSTEAPSAKAAAAQPTALQGAPSKEAAVKDEATKNSAAKSAASKGSDAKSAATKGSDTQDSALTELAPGESAVTAPSEGASDQAKRPTAIEGRVVVKVKGADDARKAILAGVKDLGGYASLITDNTLDLKVPPQALPQVLTLVAAQGIVLDKTLGRTDLTLVLAKLDGQLKSKRAILAELRALFDGSDVSATLQIERSMTDLVTELEGVKGRLRVTTDQARWAIVHVSFDFYEQQRINYVESEFEWLNSVKLERFLEEF